MDLNPRLGAGSGLTFAELSELEVTDLSEAANAKNIIMDFISDILVKHSKLLNAASGLQARSRQRT